MPLSFFGSDIVKRFYVGQDAVRRIYLGTELVWSNTSPNIYLSPGEFTLDGFPIVVTRTATFNFNAADFNITGFGLIVSHASNINLGSGDFNVTGFQLAMQYERTINLGSGTFSVTGFNLTIEEPTAPTAMPIFVGVGTAVGTVGAATPTLPTGWAQNDILGIVVVTRAGDVAVAPAGYTEGPGGPQTVGGAGGSLSARITWFYKRAGASESNPTVPDPGTQCEVIMFAIRGCPTIGDPWDVFTGSTQAAITNAANAVIMPGVTTTDVNRLIVHLIGRNIDNLGAAFSGESNANLANLTEQADFGTAAGTGSGLCIVSGEKATAGATGNTLATASPASNIYLAHITIAFKGV